MQKKGKNIFSFSSALENMALLKETTDSNCPEKNKKREIFATPQKKSGGKKTHLEFLLKRNKIAQCLTFLLELQELKFTLSFFWYAINLQFIC